MVIKFVNGCGTNHMSHEYYVDHISKCLEYTSSKIHFWNSTYLLVRGFLKYRSECFSCVFV